VHSNGFSLVRRLAADKGWKLDRPAIFDQNVILIDALMAPTRIYVKSLLPMVRTGKIHAMAHITGGGLLENIPRVLPEGMAAHLKKRSWPQTELFAWLQETAGIDDIEMNRTFNNGIGMVVVVDAANAAATAATLRASGESVHAIGVIAVQGSGASVVVA
jgi:phosphoribosylformylglycinamidine cyclo-ligase